MTKKEIEWKILKTEDVYYNEGRKIICFIPTEYDAIKYEIINKEEVAYISLEDGTLSKLFPSIEDAKEYLWKSKYGLGKITRTITLNLPSWREIQRNGEDFLRVFNYCFNEVKLFVEISGLTRTIKVKSSNIKEKVDSYFAWTEQGYLKACESIKKIFMGEYNTDNE